MARADWIDFSAHKGPHLFEYSVVFVPKAIGLVKGTVKCASIPTSGKRRGHSTNRSS